MEKLAVGPRVNPHMVSLLYPIERNLRAVASALEKPLGCAAAAGRGDPAGVCTSRCTHLGRCHGLRARARRPSSEWLVSACRRLAL